MVSEKGLIWYMIFLESFYFGIILNLQKHCKDSTEYSHKPLI